MSLDANDRKVMMCSIIYVLLTLIALPILSAYAPALELDYVFGKTVDNSAFIIATGAIGFWLVSSLLLTMRPMELPFRRSLIVSIFALFLGFLVCANVIDYKGQMRTFPQGKSSTQFAYLPIQLAEVRHGTNRYQRHSPHVITKWNNRKFEIDDSAFKKMMDASSPSDGKWGSVKNHVDDRTHVQGFCLRVLTIRSRTALAIIDPSTIYSSSNISRCEQSKPLEANGASDGPNA